MTEAAFAASDVSDACDELGISAGRSGALRPVWEGAPPVAGPLRTVRLTPSTGGSPLAELLELFSSGGVAVWLLDLGGALDCQCFGSRLALAAADAGVPGVLVNGAVRDVDELRAARFPTYARGAFPAAMKGRLGVAAVDEVVTIDEVAFAGGSYVVADSSGVVGFAAARAGEVLALASELRRSEQALPRRERR